MTTAQAIATPPQAALMPVETNELSRKRLWAGRVLTGLAGAFSLRRQHEVVQTTGSR